MDADLMYNTEQLASVEYNLSFTPSFSLGIRGRLNESENRFNGLRGAHRNRLLSLRNR